MLGSPVFGVLGGGCIPIPPNNGDDATPPAPVAPEVEEEDERA